MLHKSSGQTLVATDKIIYKWKEEWNSVCWFFWFFFSVANDVVDENKNTMLRLFSLCLNFFQHVCYPDQLIQFSFDLSSVRTVCNNDSWSTYFSVGNGVVKENASTRLKNNNLKQVILISWFSLVLCLPAIKTVCNTEHQSRQCHIYWLNV